MKYIVTLALLSGLLVYFGFKSSKPEVNKSNKLSANKANLREDIEFLTSLKPSRNFYNPESLNKVAEYIKKEFERLELSVYEQKFKVDGNEYKNIICSFGSDDASERIVVGAHYDVAGEQPGADDNASGIAGLLEIARLLHSEKPKLKYKVELVAFTLEEPPTFGTEQMGSAVHAKSLSDAKIKLKAMIALEMIGYFSEEANSQSYPFSALKLLYPSVGNFIAVVGKFGQEKITKEIEQYIIKGSDINAESINAPASIIGIDLSDHRNYWNHGYNAVMVTDTSFFRNNNYHQNTDNIETLNFNKMAEVVKGVYWAIINL